MRRSLITAIAVGCLSATSLAQSARDERPDRPQNPQNPPINAPQERPNRGDPNQPRDPRQFQPGQPGGMPFPMRMEKGAYLGVSASPAPQVVRHQLSLPRGVGLVVDTVAPKSPADEAGLKEFDVLHKLNEQVLINQQQLAVLVRTFKPDDTIKLTVFRDGKSIEVSAKLQERDLPPLEQMRLGMDGMGGMGGGVFGQFDPFRGEGGGGNPFAPGENRPNLPMIDPARPFAPGDIVNEAFSMMLDDGKIQMQITSKDGKRHLVAKEKDGKELYNGPIDTEEQIKGLPPEVRQRMPQQIGPGMLRFGFNRGGGVGGGSVGGGGAQMQRPDAEPGNRRDRLDRPEGDRPSTRPATRDGEGGRKPDRRNDI